MLLIEERVKWVYGRMGLWKVLVVMRCFFSYAVDSEAAAEFEVLPVLVIAAVSLTM